MQHVNTFEFSCFALQSLNESTGKLSGFNTKAGGKV